MDMSLEELIKRKLSLGRVDESRGCDVAASYYRRNGRGGGGPVRQDRPFARRSRGFVPYPTDSDGHSPSIGGTHEDDRRRQFRFGRRNNGGVRKIVVSNLNYKVTSEDIHNLFSEFGPLKSAALRFDRFGRSLGKADVVFGNKGAAIKAKRRYHKALLDGRFMRIQLATGLSNVPAARFRRRAVPPVTGARGTDESIARDDVARGNNSRGNPGARSRARNMPSVDELNAELDAFMQKTDE